MSVRKLASAFVAALTLAAPAQAAGPRLRFGGDLFVVSRSGDSVQRFPGGHGASYPVWSPNGKLLAFDVQIGDRDAIEVWTVGGRLVHRFDAGLATGSQPAFSPDSRKIAFTYAYYNRARDADDGLLVTHPVGGGPATRLARIAAERPAWSNEGDSVYYLREDLVGTFPQPDPIVPSIWRVNRDGTNRHRVVANTLSVAPTVSHYDANLLFMRAAGGPTRIWTATPGGENQRPLARGPFEGAPAWAPRGRGVVALRAVGSQPRLTLYRTDSGEAVPLAAAVKTTPFAWSPDGGRIAWVEGERVQTVRPDGSGRKLLFTFRLGHGKRTRFASCDDLVWGPGGARFVVSCALDEID